MKRWLPRAGIGLALLTGGFAPSAVALDLIVRDVSNGRPIAAELKLYGPADDVRAFPSSVRKALRASAAAPDLRLQHPAQRAEIELAEGAWAALISAKGFRPLTTVFDASKSAVQNWTVWLDPLTPPAYLRDADRRALALHDVWSLDGHVLDAANGQPVSGARVRIHGEDLEALTDARGYFAIELAVAELSDGMLPLEAALSVAASGYPTFTRRGLARNAGGQRLLIELGPDRFEDTAEHRLLNPNLDDDARAADLGDASALPVAAADKLLVLDPPDSIRVGFNAGNATCCGTSCTTVSVKSLETYVAQGVDDEWISSWSQQSLRAGSIAYRSYGAYHVFHPRVPASYDICSSACCQVNDNNAPGANASSAADATLGIQLERGGSEPYRSEYSAENNAWDDPGDGLSCTNTDLSCGDGYNGSPSAPWSWPCLADAVGAGRGCFGHGRGMSQWGTQRWSLAPNSRRWKWIANHYYNDNNNESGAGTGSRTAKLSSPVSIDGASAIAAPDPAPGDSFGIVVAAMNRADGIHDRILVGASLYRVGTGYISDPGNDAAVVLPEGASAPARLFLVPLGTPAGAYDLYVSLYLDVDENGAISSEDLALHLVSFPAAVQVVGDRIFYDGYQ